MGSGPEGAENFCDCVFQFCQRLGPFVEGSEQIDQNDLTVEARKVVSVEGLNNGRLVGLETALHDCPKTFAILAEKCLWQRGEGQGWAVLQIAGL